MKYDRWFPFLGVRDLHPMLVYIAGLDPSKEWKSFMFSFRSHIILFSFWEK